MKKLWAWIKKYWWVTLPTVIILAGWGIIYIIKRNVNFNFHVDKDMSGIVNSLKGRMANPETSSVEKGVGLYLDIPLKTTVDNNGIAPLSLKNVMGTISYNGETILQSKADSTVLSDVKVDAKSQKQLTDSFQVLINPQTIKFFTEIIKGNKPVIDYKINATMFGVPYSFAKSVAVNEDKIKQTADKPNI